MPRQLLGTAIAANTITTTQLQTTVVNQISAGGGPRVTSLIYPGNDTAGNTVGGQTVYINGSGFETNNAIYINGNAVPSKSFISASNLSFTTPALSAGIYPVYVINTDTGATAIFIPGYVSSAEPAWVTSAGSLSASQDELSAWSYSLSATGDAPITYALAAGSSLPGGISLAANGLISGTISSPTGNVTTYTFSVVATDAQNQDSTRQFTVTTSTGEGVLFANNVLLIHADGTNNGNNHSFLDSSNNNLTITRNGNATQGSFSPFSQTGWSGYFDGNGDYLALPSNDSAFNCGTESFTLEFWFYDNGTSALYPSIFSSTDWTPGVGGVSIRYNNSGSANKFYVAKYAGNSTPNGGSGVNELMLTSSTYPSNVWHHVAFVRNGNNFRIYVNGQIGAETTSTVSIDWNLNGAGPKIGGGNWDGGNSYIKGYISNLRLLKGTALYTSAFTPPTAPLTAIANTSLLTCQSNRFIDNSTNAFTITRNGDTSIQAFSPFAPTAAYTTANVGGSGYFDGSGDYLTLPSNAAFAYGTDPFTIEAWVYLTGDYSIARAILGRNADDFNLFITSTNGYLAIYDGSIKASTTTIQRNVWTHVAAIREGTGTNQTKLYVNGTLVLSFTNSSNISATPNYVGLNVGAGGDYWVGYISNLRVVKGTAVYTGNFTLPTAPVTAVSNTSFLINFTNAGIFDQTAKNVLETVGDAKVSTAQYKYGTGSIVLDGTGDYLLTTPTQDLEFGSGDFTIEFWWYPTSTVRQGIIHGSFGTDWSYGIDYNGTGANKIGIWASSNGSSWNLINADPGGNGIGTTTPTQNAWNHIAYVRSGTTWMLFVNGNRDLNLTSISGSIVNRATSRKVIGSWWSTGSMSQTYGYIDDLRITKGYARYTSNFTPPTSALKDK